MNLENQLEALLAGGKDGAPLRVSLALACLGRGDAADAIVHVERAIELDANYTAAWKAYGHALVMAGRSEEARAAWRHGVECAHGAGDRQAEREMRVFMRRLERTRQQ